MIGEAADFIGSLSYQKLPSIYPHTSGTTLARDIFEMPLTGY